MRFFKNFFKFQKDLNLFEQKKPDENVSQEVDKIVGGMGEENLDTKAKGKNRLDYSKKAKETEEMWKGKNYETQWKPFVDKNLDDKETFDQVVNFLKNYPGQKNAPVIKKILSDAEKKEKNGQGSLKDRIKELATDGRPGPFHTAVLQAIKKVVPELKPEPKPEPKPKPKPETKPEPKPKPKPETKPKPKPEPEPEEEPEEEETKKEPEEEPVNKPEEYKILKNDGRKSETSDQKTGHVGEREKIEMDYKAPGKDSTQQLFNLQYPVGMKEEINLAKLYFTDKTFVVGEKNVLNIDFTDKKPENRYVYLFIENSGIKNFPIQFKSYRLGSDKSLKINYTPNKEGKIKIKVVVSTVDIDQEYNNYDKKGKKIQVMNDAQCKKFLDNLLKERKPFAKIDSGKPVFQTYEISYSVNPKQEYEPDKNPELADFEKPKDGDKATRVA